MKFLNRLILPRKVIFGKNIMKLKLFGLNIFMSKRTIISFQKNLSLYTRKILDVRFFF